MSELVSLSAEPPLTRLISIERVKELAGEIDIKNTQSVLSFGVKAQKGATDIAEKMLHGVRTKDTGTVGELMNEMVHEMRGLDFDSIKNGDNRGFFAKLIKKASNLTLFLQKYETVERKIETTQNKLDKQRISLYKDIVSLDKLYTATIDMMYGLDEHIAAVEYKIGEINSEITITKIDQSDMAEVQAVNDLKQIQEGLERRLHDLKTTRMVTIQSLPSIRIVQENDKGLVSKIQSQIFNAIPLWKRNMAITIAAWRSAEAGKMTKAVTDFTNDLLVESAETLKNNNLEIRQELERGIIDVESIKKANESLIQTINDTIKIAAEGKAMRYDAESQLIVTERELKKALLTAIDAK